MQDPRDAPDRPPEVVKAPNLKGFEADVVQVVGERPIGEIIADAGLLDEEQAHPGREEAEEEEMQRPANARRGWVHGTGLEAMAGVARAAAGRRSRETHCTTQSSRSAA